ncbi:MAG: HNH endonuclease, partial [Actinomycetota bacterium]|nr:HNH endonuclease [Actinomycetota bacterium]
MYETVDRLLAGPPPRASEAELVDWIAGLEEIKCTAEAVQAEAAVRLDAAVRARQAEAGVPARKLGEGVASQVALARRVSPEKGAKLLGLAKILIAEMPHTFALMKAGRFSQWQATILARETACLSLDDRRVIDHELCATGPDGQPARAVSMGLRQLENAAKKLAITLDQASVVARAAHAAKDRRVSLRPAPDTMTWLGALLPVKDGVAVFAALDQAAKAAHAAGDERTRGQVMADTLVDRITGREAGGKPRIEVKIVMTADALANTSDQLALVEGYGPVPAAWARDALADAEVFVRRLFTDPAGRLVAMESRARKAPDGLAEFITTRDGGTCRTVGCDAPIRNIDHVERHADGGATSAENLQGLCERCNQAKEALGWRARP